VTIDDSAAQRPESSVHRLRSRSTAIGRLRRSMALAGYKALAAEVSKPFVAAWIDLRCESRVVSGCDDGERGVGGIVAPLAGSP